MAKPVLLVMHLLLHLLDSPVVISLMLSTATTPALASARYIVLPCNWLANYLSLLNYQAIATSVNPADNSKINAEESSDEVASYSYHAEKSVHGHLKVLSIENSTGNCHIYS